MNRYNTFTNTILLLIDSSLKLAFSELKCCFPYFTFEPVRETSTLKVYHNPYREKLVSNFMIMVALLRRGHSC